MRMGGRRKFACCGNGLRKRDEAMREFWMTQLIYIFRMLFAALCGSAIGYERENHLKMAGIRTHMIVAVTASLMMILSKYGFWDVLERPGVRLDPSRIAAGIVAAVGFLGASVIFTHEMNISGLTTAAGIWTTVGIGMALGAGMYAVGVAATCIVLLLQFLFHRNLQFLKSTKVEQITLKMEESGDVEQILENLFTKKKIKIASVHVDRAEPGMLKLKLYVKFPAGYQLGDILRFLKDTPEIISIDL